MRVTMFRGMRPFVSPEEIGVQFAVLAENIDFYSRSLVPFRKPSHIAVVVDYYGRPYLGEPAAFIKVGNYHVGFPQEVHWVVDPNGRGVLFVEDGKLWRLNEGLIRRGIGPTRVGVPTPDKPAVLTRLVGAGCKLEWPPHECAAGDCEDEHAQYEHMWSYRISYLNDCNEESPPSQPSEPIGVKNGDAVALTREDTNHQRAIKWRIYRSVVTTDAQVVWLHVDDVPISERSYIDRKCPIELGEKLNTELATEPPDCLEGVALAHNMRIAVWSGRDFWISRCDSVALYPERMRTRLPDEIMFMAGYTTVPEQDTHYELIAATKRHGYAVEIEEDYPHIREIPEWFPALNPFAWGYFRGGIVYSSIEGIVYMVQGVARYASNQFFTNREWVKYNPESARFTQWGERLFVWVTKGNERRGLLMGFGMDKDIREGDMTEITLAGKMAWSKVDRVEILIGKSVYLWQGDTEPMRMLWRSREDVQSGWVFPTSVKVVGDYPRKNRGLMRARKAFDIWRKVNPTVDPDTFFDDHCQWLVFRNRLLSPSLGSRITIFLDNDVLYSREVLSEAPMRLPRKRNGTVWQMEITGYRVVKELHLQTGNYDLTQEGGHA